jgi:hypothetical protein
MRRPEVGELAGLVEFPAPDDARRGQSDGVPCRHGVRILLEHGDPDPVGVDAVPLGHELERPGHGLGLEVVAEREVPEHLEEREVPGGVADVVDVQRSEAFLIGGGPRERRRGVPEEVRDELVHPGVGEQEPRLGRGDQRRGRDAFVPALFEEAQELLADPIALHGGTV